MATPLPVLDGAPAHGNRSSLTCRVKCGDACFHEVPNTSANPYLGDILGEAVSRRGLFRAGMIVAAAGVAGTALASASAPAAAAVELPGGVAPGLGFKPIRPQTGDSLVVPDGFRWDVVIRWGDRLFSSAHRFDPLRQTAYDQRRQFGYNCDFLGFLPYRPGVEIMCVNHEYTDEQLMFPAYDAANPTREQVEIAWAAHGLSVVAVRTNGHNGRLRPIVDHPLNRRFTLQTKMELSGPVRGSDLVRTTASPEGVVVRGTLNNCSGGLTPWGTWLTGEENFNQYFANGSTGDATLAQQAVKRYGIGTGPTDRKWERFDDRFDLAKEPNEVHRFGWVVEVDPYDPDSRPRKRTMLGRLKHEAGNCWITADGRAAVYTGDDERFDYFYKFVSTEKVKPRGGFKGNRTLLDHGTLYVARFTGDSPKSEIDGGGRLPSDGRFDGAGEWIPLCTDKKSFVPGMSVEEVLVFTRIAADKVGATKMDRPEDVQASPKTGKVYLALTNNVQRGTAGKAPADEVNPRNTNKHGQVLELTETRHDSAATTFRWNLLLVCGDPDDPSTYFGGVDKSRVSPISCPDNLMFDEYGNLWISTDGNALGFNDGLFALPVTGPNRGMVRQFLSVPTGAETCGPWVNRQRVNVCVQHPGEVDGATFENPASHWPDGGSTVPRPSVVSVWKA